ncbi:unnamed protein product [Peniophora sp. CBMAI 1063]|nr:unnamed protein product [Peniophora sp. CBMAI 1063]
MRVRWNSILAELQRAKLLRPAIAAYLESLPNGLSGKKKTAALTKQKKWTVSVSGWEMIDTMIDILKPFEQGTRDLSMSGVPTLCMVLPIYKSLEEHLKAQISALTVSFEDTEDEFKIVNAVKLGLDKLSIYLEKAVKSDYHLLAVVLNPQLRLQYLEDDTRWAPEVPTTPSASSATSGSLYMRSVQRQTSSQDASSPSWTLALDSYLNGAYPFPEDKGVEYILSWWSAYGSKFAPLDAIVRDILAIHGVSVSVERLFSSSGLTLHDNRARLTAVMAGKTIITKEWLKRGFGEGVDYLEGVAIWEKDSDEESD